MRRGACGMRGVRSAVIPPPHPGAFQAAGPRGPGVRGDPQSTLRWTTLSTRTREAPLAAGRVADQLPCPRQSAVCPGVCPAGQSYRRDGPVDHPQRNARFQYIICWTTRVCARLTMGRCGRPWKVTHGSFFRVSGLRWRWLTVNGRMEGGAAGRQPDGPGVFMGFTALKRHAAARCDVVVRAGCLPAANGTGSCLGMERPAAWFGSGEGVCPARPDEHGPCVTAFGTRRIAPSLLSR